MISAEFTSYQIDKNLVNSVIFHKLLSIFIYSWFWPVSFLVLIFWLKIKVQFSSVHFSRSVVSNSWGPHESQHARPPYPSPTPGVYSNSCPSSRWCHSAISSSVAPFSSCPQSLPASGFFSMIQLFTWGGQSTGVSASASVLPMNTQDWSPLGWTGWIQGTVKSLLQHHSSKAAILNFAQLSSQSNSHIHTWPLEKP